MFQKKPHPGYGVPKPAIQLVLFQNHPHPNLKHYFLKQICIKLPESFVKLI